MTNKKTIMSFSALLILTFHLWMVLPNNNVLYFIKQSAFIGVDIFFLLSAFSLARRPSIKSIKEYLNYLINRFINVYLKYIIFAFISFLYAKNTFLQFIKQIFTIELFEKFGGSFLWFIPSIMFFYILYPIFKKCDEKKSILTFIVISIIWSVVALLSTNKLMFIIWNRIPIFLIGHYMYKINKLLDNKKIKFFTGIIFTIVGLLIVYNFTYKTKLHLPITDSFYLLGIPLVIGLVLLLSFIPEFKIFKLIGSATLEIYAIQMIFGYKFANQIYLQTKDMVLTNLIVTISIIFIGCIVNHCFKFANKLFIKIKN